MTWFTPFERAPSAMDRMEAEIHYLRHQNMSLLNHVLRLSTSPVHAAEAPIQPVKARPADVVQEALSTAAGNNTTLRRALGVYARTARADKVPESEIAHTLLNWPEADDE